MAPKRVARNATAPNTLAKDPILKIHPSIGIARVGDAPTAFFIGPERPLAGNTGQADGAGSAVPSYRDGGKIKRQAARFRIYNYPSATAIPEELYIGHPDVTDIEWTVHLANKKAAFFEFQGQKGAPDFVAAPQDRRNKTIPAADRATKLMIDPGPRSIKGANAGPIAFNSGSGNWPKNLAGAPVIDYLGELRTDAKGRLLVLGGRGKSVSSDALTASALQMAELTAQGYSSGPRPPAPLLHYANNDTWFDDISDGPVTAQVTLKTGKKVTVKFPAWVLVGPPDFAPGVRNVVSLYDAALDIAVQLPDPALPFYSPLDLADLKGLKASLSGTAAGASYQPEWFLDIEPTIMAGYSARYVHQPVAANHGSLNPVTSKDLVFLYLRPPAGNTTYSGPGSMPKLYGDNYNIPGDVRRVVAVTKVQYHILTLWKAGNFLTGSGGPSPNFTPEGLDRASLESCVGGAFYPGIECSWLMRNLGLWDEPFRIKHGATVGSLTVGPGFFSEQMAVPWQADFMDCRRGDINGSSMGWWPAQRPDEVYLSATDAAAGTNMQPWHRGVVAGSGTPRGQSHLNMVQKWNGLGFVVSATSGGKDVFVEQDRTLP